MKTTKQNLLDDLKAGGFDVQEHKRLGIMLDGLTVDLIVDQIPISFERRRYSNCTFCWVKFYVAGWAELGDPWKCVTPSVKAISEALQDLRSKHV